MCKIYKKKKMFSFIIVDSPPEVTLYEVSPVHFHDSVVLKADISKDFHRVIWKKHDQDINNPKYEVCFNEDGSSFFCINNAKKEDAGTYTIEVQNEFGIGQSCQKFEVVRGTCILYH